MSGVTKVATSPSTLPTELVPHFCESTPFKVVETQTAAGEYAPLATLWRYCALAAGSQVRVRVESSHICTIHDIGVHDSHAFLVMELLDGMTLKQRIGNRPMNLDVLLPLALEFPVVIDTGPACRSIPNDVSRAPAAA